MIRESHAATAAAGTIQLGERLLIVKAPTPEDEMLIEQEFRRQCRPLLKSPLQRIAEDAKDLPPALAELAIRAAVELQAGSRDGLGEPSEDMVLGRVYSADGCAFRIWVLARHAHPELKLSDVRAVVTDENVIEMLARLWQAMRSRYEEEPPEKKADLAGG